MISRKDVRAGQTPHKGRKDVRISGSVRNNSWLGTILTILRSLCHLPVGGRGMTSTLPEPIGKTCRCCRIDRPIAAFFPCRFTADGYSERCRSCVAAAAQRDREDRERRRASKASRSISQPYARS